VKVPPIALLVFWVLALIYLGPAVTLIGLLLLVGYRKYLTRPASRVGEVDTRPPRRG
jgi:hypothetical protein